MRKLEDALRDHVLEHPDKTAVICAGLRMTYRELFLAVSQRVRALLNSGKSAGFIGIYRVTQDLDCLIQYFAIHQLGGVAVPLEKDLPECLFQAVQEQLEQATLPVGTADVLYTTGTSGQPKGVCISHETILANAENLIDAQGFTPEHTFIICGPLNHIGSLSKVYPVILQGGTLIILEGMKNAEQFFDALEYPCSRMATFLVPSSIRMLIQFSAERLAGYAEKIDFIETGAAPIAQADMETLCRLLPHSRLYNTYASTESGIIATHNFNEEGRCIAGCLGRPMKHSRICIQEDGTIACQGKTLMLGYVAPSPGQESRSMLRGDTLYTKDLGYLDETGALHLTGREGDVINVGGFKVEPSEVEEAALSLPWIQDCICISVPHPITGRALKLLVVLPEGMPLDRKTIARHIRSRLETYKVPMLYEQVEAVCRTFNGKLNRKAYL